MESRRNQTEVKPPSTAPRTSTITLCRRKKKEDATFLEDLKDHIDEFIYASMDENKSCFTKTIQKKLGMSKVVKQRTSDQQEIECSASSDNNLKIDHRPDTSKFSG